MKKLITILFLSFFMVLPSCDIIKEELGIDLGTDKDQDNKEDNNEDKEDENPQINVNVKKTPCAYFTFNGTYEDLSGNDNYAYGNPEPTFVTGPKSGTKAIAFSRANRSRVVINDGLIDTPSMTVSFWVKDIDEGTIFFVTSSNKVYDASSSMMWLSYTNGIFRYVMTRDHCYGRYGSGKDIGYFTHKSIDDGEWHHIVLVSDHNVLKRHNITTRLYIDGTLMDTQIEPYSASEEENPDHSHFGTGTKFIMGGDNTPNMKIANLRVYDEWQLPADEVKKLYTSGL